MLCLKNTLVMQQDLPFFLWSKNCGLEGGLLPFPQFPLWWWIVPGEVSELLWFRPPNAEADDFDDGVDDDVDDNLL